MSRLSRHWAHGTALYLTTVASGTSFDSLDASVWGAGGDVSLSMVATWVGLNVTTLCVWSFAAGWVLAALPIALGALMFVIAPEHMGLLFTDPLGIRLIVGAGVLQFIGFIAMQRIVNIEI